MPRLICVFAGCKAHEGHLPLYVMNGLSNPYHLDESIFNLWGGGSISSSYLVFNKILISIKYCIVSSLHNHLFQGKNRNESYQEK